MSPRFNTFLKNMTEENRTETKKRAEQNGHIKTKQTNRNLVHIKKTSTNLENMTQKHPTITKNPIRNRCRKRTRARKNKNGKMTLRIAVRLMEMGPKSGKHLKNAERLESGVPVAPERSKHVRWTLETWCDRTRQPSAR